jgi:hypothetical protein
MGEAVENMAKFWMETILYWVTIFLWVAYYYWQTGDSFLAYIVLPLVFVLTLIDYAITNQKTEQRIDIKEAFNIFKKMPKLQRSLIGITIWTIVSWGIALMYYFQTRELWILYLAVIGEVLATLVCYWTEREMRRFWLRMAFGTAIIWLGILSYHLSTGENEILYFALVMVLIHTPVLYWIDKATTQR